MPVTIRPASHGANPFQGRGQPAGSAFQLLEHTSFKEYKKVKNQNILESSFQDITSESNVYGRSNGFVDGAITAYNEHHHLEIRPDDVWFSILAQLNIYINEHSEELRDMFVAHKCQKNLQVKVDNDLWGTGAFGVDWAKVSVRMTGLIDENIKDRTLREWILPQFTTTTNTDTAVASILMMATMKKYFTYSVCTSCGLPSVTLLGHRSDWERLVTMAERLPTFGAEPTTWYGLLKPVLARFVTSFDAPEAEETKDFWQKIVHYANGGSGPTYLSVRNFSNPSNC
jgi:hypothetical protein